MKRELILLAAVGLVCIGTANAALEFPALTNCNQRANSTVFRINSTISTSTPAQTYCFGFSTGTPANAQAPCAKAATLERVQLWASYDQRRSITRMSIRDDKSETTVFGSWARKDDSQDELVFSKLGWTASYITSSRPRICITLAASVKLDSICLGPLGKCVFALYSLGGSGSKCCPVSTLSVPAPVTPL